MKKATHWFAALVVAGAGLLTSNSATDAHGRHRDPCPPPPPVTVILPVCHPCTGCRYDVPVCIPACCVGAPCVRFERTLIGAGRTVYEWPTGYQVVVRYQKDGGYRVIHRD